MTMNYKFPIIFVFLLSACGTRPKILQKKDREVHNLALFLSGLPVPNDSRYFPLTQKSFYAKHIQKMEKFRLALFEKHLHPMRAWARENLIRTEPGIVIYPFSGADVTNMLTLFPDDTVYFMIALQKAGSLPKPDGMSDTELSSGLSGLRYTIHDIASRNYFRSAVLRKGDRKKNMQGLLPVILTFLATLGNEVRSVEYVRLDLHGQVADTAEENAQGVRIRFWDSAGKEKVLVYLRERLSPLSTEGNAPIAMFFHSYDKTKLMFKAAIYLLHEKSYENFALVLSKKADLIIQDDSGIPLKFFPRDEWNFFPHGKYNRTPKLNDLRKYPLQKDLKELFSENLLPLPFDYGYGSLKGKGFSNLLILKRKSLSK